MYYRYSNPSSQSGFRANRPLSNEEIAVYAPSVLATEPHSSRGERYAFIPTLQVLDGLRGEGFQPIEVRQTKVRDQSRREHTKHMIRLRREGFAFEGNDAEVPELVLLNSHDGTSAYQLLAGVFRMVCSNGLIAGTMINEVKVRHSGRVIDDVIEGSFEVIENVNEVASSIDRFKSIQLDAVEQERFAHEAKLIRWDDAPAPVSDIALLRRRRFEDRSNSLWDTFNVVQENLIRGGLRGLSRSNRRTSTRAVSGVNENVRINRALWALADQYANGRELGVAA